MAFLDNLNCTKKLSTYQFVILLRHELHEYLFAGIRNLFGCSNGPNCEVGLQTHHKKFVVAEENGKANANRDKLDIWEIFSVIFIGENKVQLKGHHGKYLGALSDGTVNANQDLADLWETWTVEQKVSGLAFKSYHGKYLVAESNGELKANRHVADIWEIFRVVHPLQGKARTLQLGL